MKITLTSLILFISLSAGAQKFELGFNGGLSNTAKPTKTLYDGDEGKWTYATGLNLHYNINRNLQAGLDVQMTRWERKTEWPLYGTNNQYMGMRNVDYIFAERALSFALRFNYVIPFEARYEDFVRSSLYVGISAGAVATGSEGKIEYARALPNSPSDFNYVSKYQYESGYGGLLGAQIGYSYYFSRVIGVNIEFAPKFASVKTTDSRYNHANNTYNILYFPTTLGLRIRLGKEYDPQ
ncbi:MAG TPA: hypothetical protein VL098_09170 [Flavipsychrobacter sp.]|nr:hypothetical protein [Flavipsychrobacter sp.]